SSTLPLAGRVASHARLGLLPFADRYPRTFYRHRRVACNVRGQLHSEVVSGTQEAGCNGRRHRKLRLNRKPCISKRRGPAYSRPSATALLPQTLRGTEPP